MATVHEKTVQQQRTEMVKTIFPEGIPTLWCPLLTHYRADGSIDTVRIAAHIRHMRPHIPAFLAPGTTGDGWEMSGNETESLIDFLLGEAEQQDFSVMLGVLRTEPGTVVPAIANIVRRYSGASLANGADAARLRSRHICGFTVTPPKGAQLDQVAIHRELEAIAETGVPLAIYQLPQITENEMSGETVADLVARFPNVYLMKDTSGRDAVVLSGCTLDNLFLVRGAEGEFARWSKAGGGHYDGFLLSTANCFAAELASMIAHLDAGRVADAEELSERVSRVIGELLEAAGPLSFGNPFTNANKAIDHHYAWGSRAEKQAPPMTHSGNRLPDALLNQAAVALKREGFQTGDGYMWR